MHCVCVVIILFKQKTSYEVRISDGSSDVCSTDLVFRHLLERILLDQRQRRVRTVAHGFVEVADILHRQTAPPGAAAVEVRMVPCRHEPLEILEAGDRKSTRLNSSH